MRPSVRVAEDGQPLRGIGHEDCRIAPRRFLSRPTILRKIPRLLLVTNIHARYTFCYDDDFWFYRHTILISKAARSGLAFLVIFFEGSCLGMQYVLQAFCDHSLLRVGIQLSWLWITTTL
jgi:hypothetical protein